MKPMTRFHRLCVAAAAALVASGCAGGSDGHGSTGGATPTPSTTSTPSLDPLAAVSRPIDDLGKRHQATIPVEGAPDWPLVAFGSVWVSNSGTNQVQRFDPRTNAVVGSLTISQPCNGLAAGAGAVWTGSCAAGGYVVRIDPAGPTIVASRQVPLASDGEGQVTYGFGSVWVATGDGRLIRFDPGLTRQQASIAIPVGASAALADQHAVWVTSPAEGRLLRVDPVRNTVAATYATGGHPQFLTSGFGSVWTLNQTDGTVTRVDEATGSTTTVNAESPGEGGCITSGLDAVWLTIYTKPLTRVDPTTGQVTEQLTGDGGDCVVTGFGSVWVTNNRIASMYRIAPV